MVYPHLLTVMLMLLVPVPDESENPWKEKVPAALRRASATSSVSALADCLDVAWRADDWQAGLQIVRRAQQLHSQHEKLNGLIVRALWRAGQVAEAEQLAAQIAPNTSDHVALRALLVIHLARGELQKAVASADRLAQLKPHSPEDLYDLFGARLAANQMNGLPELLRKAERLTDPRDGYPQTFYQEAIEGVADFLDAVGPRPLNEVTQYGTAEMPPLVLLRLPSCEVFINGHGPYRLVLDTGGSTVLALDQEVADEVGLKSYAAASIRGVSGKQATGQALVEELKVGGIHCRRVVTRTFNVRSAVANAADGVLGTGIFAHARLSLDFAGGQFTVSASSDRSAAGRAVPVRIMSDAKIMALVTLEAQPAVALLDTGADAVALSPARLKQLFPDRPVQSFTTGIGLGVGTGQMPEITLGTGVALEIGGRMFKNYGGLGLDVLDETLSPLIGVQTDILLGMPTFREMKSCTIDFETSRMWIEWLEASE